MRKQNNQNRISVIKETRKRPPSLPWLRAKNAVLGHKYDLSLILANNRLSKSLNKKYRKKNKPTNVLAFPYSKNLGEILLNLELARTEAPYFNHSYKKHCAYLFIHALLHLKGYAHGSKMESKEKEKMRLLGF